MEEIDVHERYYKKYRNIIYLLISYLLVLQIAGFLILSNQVVGLNDDISKSQEEVLINFDQYDSIYRERFVELSERLARQERDFSEDIWELQATTGDFSEVVEHSVKGVVGVVTQGSSGSGFYINSEGNILTNYHVVEGYSEIIVINYLGETFDGVLVGWDPARDLAVLEVDDDNIDFLELESDSEVRTGEKVIAIGNPLGLSFSVTEGIISAKDREGLSGLEEYIQTDVPLNPGNSGGPLINTGGKVVGMNNFKIGEAEGLGFSLQSDSLRDSINKIDRKLL